MKLGLLLFFLSLILSFVLLNPWVRQQTSLVFNGDERVVLSQLDFKRDQADYKLVKLSTARGLVIEIYRKESGSSLKLDSQQLADKKDAFYKFETRKLNLFLKDINGDGVDEVIVPSLDRNLRARMNVFSFDPVLEKLQKVTQH